ncbi:NAD(P)H-hydrate dehydratase [Methylococcus capsulatus]|uniref:NAD(P)H-hydrate dehydratase n=1 Tax=Methylococcus capsulatus TaxID=414 RepID=UPI001C52C78B|nr:NAD(P)H-hydrate dehydratase [Methylococcus capsulatus]QXP87982.1 NAD(P)H-hydrate dehydratase [Methylococcus capsulatus]QXP95005.1 NAD(P)H-hydrate dehydratase [Methylococcus capsulatus]UQN13006.1 NAD(P)H-hydrate dehydratase [Methylococcus capsulatus]
MPSHSYDSLPTALFTAAQVRAMDRHAIDRLGIPGLELMHRAGAAAFEALRRRWPEAKTLSVVCGPGNNGGDGYVIARLALAAGFDVRAYPVGPVERLRGDGAAAFAEYRNADGPLLNFIPPGFEGAEILVDALLGTGLDRDVTDEYAAVIDAVNDFPGKVVAVDIPSGLNADTGAVMGNAVRADLTVSFIGLKQGLFTGAGPAHCGEIVFDDLDTPPEIRLAQTPSSRLLRSNDFTLPTRRRDAHKGHYGHVLVIGGECGYSGAARMAAEAAARTGAGLVSIATRTSHAPLLNVGRPELMVHGAESGGELGPLLQRASVLALGPGLGQGEWAKALFDAALDCGKPAVIDADALNLLAKLPRRCDHWILTPHPGEAARLLGVAVADVQRDRFAAVSALQRRYGGVAVLKGAGTLIAGPDGVPHVARWGNPGMASGGMGDVLTGVIAGLRAQHVPPFESACLGVRIHGQAGDLAASAGERGLLAGDLIDALRACIN